MTGALDTRSAATALRIINRLGKTYTFDVVTNPGAYDTSDGSVTGRVVTQYTDVVGSPPVRPEKAFEKSPSAPGDQGDVTQQEEIVIYLARKDLAFTPVNGMIVTLDSVKWTAFKTDPLYSGELIAAWRVTFIRRQI